MLCMCGGCSQCLADQGFTRADFEAMRADLEALSDEEYRFWVEALEVEAAEYADTDTLPEAA
jgi:hypothetical protein